MTTNADDKRSLTISAEAEVDLLKGLAQIPGYKLADLDEDVRRRMCLPREEERFILQASNGEEIIVSHRKGELQARTHNVLKQDALDHAVPLHEDEVVKLHKAIQDVKGLSSAVTAAEIDLLPPASKATNGNDGDTK